MSDERETANDARPPRYGWSADKLPDQIAHEIKERRIAGEKAHYERGIPVAGHDNPAREAMTAAWREIEKYQALQERLGRAVEKAGERNIRNDAER